MTKKPDELGWIDINAKTPFFDESVLIYTVGRGIQIGYLDSETHTMIGPDYCGEITHWQSLPGKPIGNKLATPEGSDGRFTVNQPKF